ncbi:TBC1 domain family member 31 [Armadillidium vulgare]|nr:TBC1 domain family member 31 [Armadillidium vulgare]
MFLTQKSKLKSNGHVIEAGHIYELKLIFVAFENGLVLLWDEEDKSMEKVIQPPEGISMKYRSFSLSSDGKWLIGTGSQALMVIYSMNCLRVGQVVQFSHIDSPLGIYDHLFSASKWKEILNEFGEYPTRYRKHIWISLMKLPRNYSAINDILMKGKKHRFEGIKNISIDIDSPTLESLRNVLELLCIWSPIVVKLEFLPRFLLPFVKIFNRDILLCFEASMFIFLNWFRLLLNSWPSTSSIATEIVKQLLSENDSKLLIHFKKLKINIEDVAWSLMASGFREVLNEEDWLIAWDHILSKPNSYIIAFCAGLISQLRNIILRSSQKEVLLDLFHRETCIPIRLYLKRAETLHKNMLHESQEMKIDEKIILPKGSLPVFDIYSEDLKMTHKLASNFSNGHCKDRNSHGPVDDVFRMDHPDVTHLIHEKSLFINKGPVETSHLRTKEDECLRNIQRVRKKIINQVII